MSRPSPVRRRGRAAPTSHSHGLLAELGFTDLSWPIIGWTTFILAIGFGPLLVSGAIEATGVTAQFLAALGPVLVCLAFAGLTLKYGMRYGAEAGWSRRGIWLLVAMFVALAGLVGWALFVSV